MNINFSGLMGSASQQNTQQIPLDLKLNQIEVTSTIMASSIANSEIDLQNISSIADTYMMSEEAQKNMNLISGTAGNDTITSKLNQEDGSITINVNGQETTYTAEQALNGFKVELGDGNDSIDLSAIYNSTLINAGEGDNNITLGQGRNIVTAGDGNNTIKAEQAHRNNITTGNGNNKINVTGNTNAVTTGDGNDSVIVAGNDNKISTGAGTDIINARSEGNNHIDAGAGNDVITANGKKNNIYGGDGNDYIKVSAGDNYIEGGKGNDHITAGTENNVRTANGKKNDIYGGDGDDYIKVGDGDNYIEGGKGDDQITAGNGDNIIYGLSGNDTIKVGDGNNYIDGGKDNDNITVGKGKNTITGGLGDDTINAKDSSGKIFDDKNGGTINASENMKVNRYDSSECANLGSSVKIEGSDDFKERVESDLETFRATESGKKLLSELDKSKKTVTITKIDEQNGFAAPEDDSKSYPKTDGTKGEGTNTKIGFNPSFRDTKEGFLPADVLFHEGIHGYNNATGTKQPETQSQEDGSTVKKAERQAVGLSIDNGIEVTHPDGTKSANNPEGLTENAIRAELGIDKREIY